VPVLCVGAVLCGEPTARPAPLRPTAGLPASDPRWGCRAVPATTRAGPDEHDATW